MSVRGFHALARRLGVPVQVGALQTRGLFDRATKSEPLTGKDFAPHLAGSPSVLLETLTGLGMGDPLTVDGEAFTVRDLIRESDGGTTRYFLAETP